MVTVSTLIFPFQTESILDDYYYDYDYNACKWRRKEDKLAIMNIFDYNCDSEKDGEVEMIAVIFGSGSGLL